MDRIVDLDAVREELDCRRTAWEEAGIAVGAPSAEPGALDLTLTGAGDRYARIVVRAGGWADVDGFDGTEIFVESPTFADVPGCVAAVDAVALRLTRR